MSAGCGYWAWPQHRRQARRIAAAAGLAAVMATAVFTELTHHTVADRVQTLPEPIASTSQYSMLAPTKHTDTDDSSSGDSKGGDGHDGTPGPHATTGAAGADASAVAAPSIADGPAGTSSVTNSVDGSSNTIINGGGTGGDGSDRGSDQRDGSQSAVIPLVAPPTGFDVAGPAASDPATQPVPQAAPRLVPQAVPQLAPRLTPRAVPQAVPQLAPQVNAPVASQPTAQAAPPMAMVPVACPASPMVWLFCFQAQSGSQPVSPVAGYGVSPSSTALPSLPAVPGSAALALPSTCPTTPGPSASSSGRSQDPAEGSDQDSSGGGRHHTKSKDTDTTGFVSPAPAYPGSGCLGAHSVLAPAGATLGAESGAGGKVVTGAPKQMMLRTTGYSFQDNQGGNNATISCGTIHKTAGGTGTYPDPITVATPGHAGQGTETPCGTRIYVPDYQRYFIVEDTGATKFDTPHIDIYVGGEKTSKSASDKCMNPVTKAAVPAIINPPPGEPVMAGPITQDGSCRVPNAGAVSAAASSS